MLYFATTIDKHGQFVKHYLGMHLLTAKLFYDNLYPTYNFVEEPLNTF